MEVVIDVPTGRLDGAFTYDAGAGVELGARVRVPLGSRAVNGWVIGPANSAGVGSGEVKQIDAVDDEAALLDPAAIELAAWLRRRYVCTYREALMLAAPKATNAAAHGRYAFEVPPQGNDATGDAIFNAVGSSPFTLVTASRALRRARIKLTLPALRREFDRLLKTGALARRDPKPRAVAGKARPSTHVVMEDAARARGPAQRRLAAVLLEAQGTLPSAEALRRADVTKATLARARHAGVLRIEEVAPPEKATAAVRPAAFESTRAQADAIDRIDAAARAGHAVALLHGVTGSGKTHIYAQLVDRVRGRGGTSIVLVPEISLTPQTAARFGSAFGDRVGVLHSGLSHAERDQVWRSAAAGALDVVVGARSAVFAPLPGVRLIVVDEEQEPSYKQDVAPRYDAQAVARQRMAAVDGLVVFGSATPSLEIYNEALEGSILHVRLSERATNAPLPPVEIVDMTAERGERARRPLGPTLIAAVDAALRRGEKALLFVNRRGYAGVLLCRACGFAPRCRRCSVSLVVHSADSSLRCHVCGAAFRVPPDCPKCHALELRPLGYGTQRVEEEARALFPSARIVRMDADTTGARGAHRELLRSFGDGGDILIGTQMIAKGLDFPTVTVVGVIAADVDLHRPDFRAAERTFALLTQVAGRAGRASPGSSVIVQTYSPDHYAVTHAARHDYESFARRELAMRRELGYPPFGRLAYIGIAAVDAAAAESAAARLAGMLRTEFPGVQTLGPAPDPLPKARGEYRLRIALKSRSLDSLLDAAHAAHAARSLGDVRVTITVEPR
ncbi:MAG TPA: primosomal protein N' [Candidatus Eremiobacteraceae bacterium]|nr:primosomal protein N' [Candidatus Eremiobacteraceae bacterium]